MMPRLRFLIGFALAFAGFSAVARAQAPVVVATNPLLADLARTVGGDFFEVRTIIPEDVSYRDFEPDPGSSRILQDARVVIANGIELEPWLDRFLADAGYTGELVTAGEGLSLLDHEGRLHEPDEEPTFDHGVPDPFAWHDPRNVRLYVQTIATVLMDLEPGRVADIDGRLRAFLKELDDLDAFARTQFAAIPPGRRILATSLEFLGYLAHAYEFSIQRVIAPGPGLLPETPAAVQRATAFRELNVPAVFVAGGVNPRTVRFIEQESGVTVVTSLSEGPAGGAGWAATFRRNVETIARALR